MSKKYSQEAFIYGELVKARKGQRRIIAAYDETGNDAGYGQWSSMEAVTKDAEFWSAVKGGGKGSPFQFKEGKEKGVGEGISTEGESIPCKSKAETQVEDFSGKDTRKISLVAKKWVRISQYEANSKKGKKVMDNLKARFDAKATELCLPKNEYKIIKKVLEVIDIDETPAYGLETKLQIGISGMVECI